MTKKPRRGCSLHALASAKVNFYELLMLLCMLIEYNLWLVDKYQHTTNLGGNTILRE